MLIFNKFTQDPQRFTDCPTNLNPRETAMTAKVTIYGKNSWPHTAAAREAYASKGRSVEYISVIDDPHALNQMLLLSKGQRKIPVVVDGERVAIGYQGKGWTI